MSVPLESWDVMVPVASQVCASLLYLAGKDAPVIAIACQGQPGHEGTHWFDESRSGVGRVRIYWQSHVLLQEGSTNGPADRAD